MRRADRLFTIVQLLRGGRSVTARRLAERLEVSERTVYRDVDELTLCGVPIEGEPGRGYRLPATFEIPPLMFERHEIEALVVGVRLVEAWCGPGLAASARSALARIRGAVPAGLVDGLEDSRVFAPRFARGSPPHFEIAHRAIGERRRLVFSYANEANETTRRTVRPLGLYYWGKVWTLAAWCELRDDFRSFRLDRIREPAAAEPFDEEPGKSLEAYLAHARGTVTEPARRGAAMTYDEFMTVDRDASHRLSPPLAALALDRAGHWDAAHEHASAVDSPQTNRVHAYLHRKEGNVANASYWYDNVGETMPEGALDEEWNALVRRFL